MGGCMSSPKDLAMEGEAPVEIPVSAMPSEAEPIVQEEKKEEAKVDEVEKKEEGAEAVAEAAPAPAPAPAPLVVE